ncbi:bifunctional metallophosphatase/5'-nucleotidase [Tessaracoccus sp. OS52]|uniref:bifunctional metallophosphatase/5'-nucleotidase n=1 Tax=Tessaracoccus sp. OS52 TaxID=2886691 RepID=UPI001D0FB2C2|nr:bifunctional UDP-sugar hydrolase/5'-nucleotidase [Tessaracoccus sp. OS52]MCC2594077.1 bifunctional metallophosphatase/5'-nucleotidase [Tessaracoccus sp. OS52]
MKKLTPRLAAGLAPAMVLGGLTFGTVAAPTVAHAYTECVAPDSTVSVFSFNDFHGRVESAARLFTVVENERDAVGEDNVLLLSAGDNIGASTFVSMIQNDNPTLEILDAIDVDAVAAGNHEFDKGWADLRDRVIPFGSATIPYLAANVYTEGTTDVPAPLAEYDTFTKGGLEIAVIGAVTGDLPSLVSPAGLTGLTVGDPVEAINRVAAEIEAAGTADVVIASIHEGAPDGWTIERDGTITEDATIEDNAATPGAFADMANELEPNIDVVFNGHTHQIYNWVTLDDGERPILQASSYGTHLAKVELGVNSDGTYCGIAGTELLPRAAAPGTQARIVAIQEIVSEAVATAESLGAQPVGFANRAISTPGAGNADTRNVESPMTNMVAQMFYDQLSNGNDEFIGVQNPGGTRDSFDRGTITYEEAALVLPFANSLMTTQVTGAQFKEALEQQWQRTSAGEVPSRPYLALGLSENVSYTFDESLPEGERITGIHINGEPMDMAKLYTVGSGSFLISGGDNFRAFGEGVNTADTGRADLEAWVEWVEQQDALWPDYSKRGVSLTDVPTTLTEGAAPVEVVVGAPLEGGVQVDTLDMFLNDSGDKVSPQVANTDVTAWIGDEIVGGGTVTDGVATVNLAIAQGTELAAGTHTVALVVEPSGTEVLFEVNVALTAEPVEPEQPFNVYTTEGLHRHNGRLWMTACEPYSQTERCWTLIWATQVDIVNGQVFKRNAWTFNNLTYLPMARSAWANNPLGYEGKWTAADGRRWYTECDNARTGDNACRSYAEVSVVSSVPRAGGGWNYVPEKKFVFNNIVLFS